MNPSAPPAAPFSITVLDPKDAATAAGMLAVLQAAHAQEAQLLGIAHTAPTPPSLHALQHSTHFHLGALQAGRTVGVLALGPDEETSRLCITTLVVHPQAQRRGIARGLVQAALQRGPGMAFVVTATSANTPALRLYTGLGFVPCRTGELGHTRLPVTQLICPNRGTAAGPVASTASTTAADPAPQPPPP